MLWYFDLFLQKSWFSKTNNCSFCNKTTQDFAEFWEIWVNFKAKTKTEDEGILRKGKRSSSWFLSLHIGLAGWEENQIFCYAKRPNLSSLIMVRYSFCFTSRWIKTAWIRRSEIFHRHARLRIILKKKRIVRRLYTITSSLVLIQSANGSFNMAPT